MMLSWRMRSGLQVLDDSYDYELTKNGVSEERTDGAYILVKYCKADLWKLIMKRIEYKRSPWHNMNFDRHKQKRKLLRAPKPNFCR